jgi:hypothetical protein
MVWGTIQGLSIAAGIYLFERNRGEKTVEKVPVVLDYIMLMLEDLRKRGFDYPSIIIWHDGSGNVSTGLGKDRQRVFRFNDIDGIATDYIKWQGDLE